MIPIEQITGRLGNKMFQFAFLFSYSKDNVLDWYYQDPYFFKDYENGIRTLYSGDIPNKIDAIAIHVRRGDYVNNPFYVDLTKTDYYERAMALFPNEQFVVFSDDIEWCKKKWRLKDHEMIKFSKGKTDVEDMNLMAACKGQIIANSSFSWWGAWLSPMYPDNKVIAPKQWYADGDNSRTILPKHWKRI